MFRILIIIMDSIMILKTSPTWQELDMTQMVDGVPHPQGHLPEFSINLNFEFCRTQHSFVFDSGTNLVFQVNILLSTKLISVLSRLVKIYQINSLLAQFVIILKKYNFDEKITHYFSLCFQLLECAICNDKVLNSFFGKCTNWKYEI